MQGELFVVGTPIGNLSDMSPRAVETLEKCDFIAAEDTRVTLKLLNHFNIKKSMISYFEHNRREKGEVIVKRILNGENCALVTDAGMPAISDPGEELVAQCHEAGIKVNSVPGPCAFSTALAISGMPAGRFTFEGFLSMNKKNRAEHIQELVGETRTMVFYEAPHKLKNTLADLYGAFGDRRISIVRELTKIHEQVIDTTLSEACRMYETEQPKGEIVLIVAGAGKKTEAKKYSLQDAVDMAMDLVAEENTKIAAAKEASSITGIKKREIYAEICK